LLLSPSRTESTLPTTAAEYPCGHPHRHPFATHPSGRRPEAPSIARLRSFSTRSIVAKRFKDKVKAIGDLLRLRYPEGRAFGIDATTIPRDRHDFRMLAEPFGKALGSSMQEEGSRRGANPD
jgi:hypothetical protein